MVQSKKLVPEEYRSNTYPSWAPRFWNGMRLTDYFRLLRQNRFGMSPLRYPMSVMVGGCAVINSSLSPLQSLFFGKTIRDAEFEGPPIFILGHWRSGTTLIHELLALDENLAFPNNFDAFVPHHFLVSKPVIQPLIHILLPAKRPMDNMRVGVTSPQEDDFALCVMGAPTPYRRIAFPNHVTDDHRQLDPNNMGAKELDKLRNSLDYFYKALTVKYKKQLVLKSPPHTGRIKKLAEWFPGAKFIHLARHPYKLVPSTMRLWQTIDEVQGFQIAKYSDRWLFDYICDCKNLMYEAYSRDKSTLEPNQIIELDFDRLLADPVAQLRHVYDQFEMPGIEDLVPRVEQYFANRKQHKNNPNKLSPQLKDLVDENWQDYCDQFGFSTNQSQSVESPLKQDVDQNVAG